jgi:hypothetical protein
MNLQENIQRIKEMMNLYEQSNEIKIKPSVKGNINFFDKDNKKVYIYRVQARVENGISMNIFIKSFDDTNGNMTFINPQDESEEEVTIPMEKINEMRQKAPLKQNITNIYNFKKLTKQIEIDLIFIDEKTLNIV